jgi:uncharacterized membrane protein YbhN (UPF0104 family)
MKLKPGYRTSEFWFTVVSFIFSGLFLTGILAENEQKEELINTVSHAVESCILIGGQLIILYKYVNGRTKIKQQFEEKELKHESDQNSQTTTKPRSNKSRSRQPNSKRKNQSSSSKKTSGK